VSQPFDRKAEVKIASSKVDKKLNEFWITNPFDIVKDGKNLSAFERKRVFMNVRGGNFLDLSYLSGADNDGDGRSVVAADFRNCGQLDVAVRQVGGGAFLLYENHYPKRHYLEVTLRGKPEIGNVPTSNRQGIGARLIAEIKDRKVVREQFPANGFRSRAPYIVHFGLADDTQVDRLVIRWPSGKEQVLRNVPGDQHIVIEEDNPDYEKVVPGELVKP
jgi:enediyne biosynthesis protein E4